MLEKAKIIIDKVAEQTDSVILWHSLAGKDSIVMLDLLYPKFKRVACVFEYMVRDMRAYDIYADYAKRKYPNIELYQIPHHVLYGYIKYGAYGKERDKTQKTYSLADMNNIVQKELGIEWSCFGFKQSDSLNRKVMLRGLEYEAINSKTKKFYPLSHYKNKDMLNYIKENNLKKPIQIEKGEASCGCCIDDAGYMKWLQMNYPDDYEKVCIEFPKCNFVIKLDEDKRQRETENIAW